MRSLLSLLTPDLPVAQSMISARMPGLLPFCSSTQRAAACTRSLCSALAPSAVIARAVVQDPL